MKNQSSNFSVVACMAIISCVSGFLHADTVAYSATGTETDLGAYGLSGIEFTLNSNINVTSLGFSALSLNTAGDMPQVTVWQVGSGGTLTQLYTTGNIVSDVITQGTNENLNAQAATFTYVPVSSSLLLSSGNTYLVTAPAYWVATYDSSGISTAGGGVFTSTSFESGPGWNGNWDNTSYLGASPNISSFSASSSSAIPAVADFQFNVDEVAVPEPSTYALLGAGVAFLVLHLRRRRAQV